jgi:hypothetical protein
MAASLVASDINDFNGFTFVSLPQKGKESEYLKRGFSGTL